MKLTELDPIVSTFGEEFESQAFTIEVNEKSLRILFDGMYERKIEAVVREIWSNALDSHIEAGYPERPFDCRLPTLLDPTFSVRDTGVSMTHDMVMNIYTKVFKSTKDKGPNANLFVGQFGMGSKSPFAYIDSFSIIAWLNGEKRTYLVSLNTGHIPTVMLLAREASDEPDGVEVSFPVKPSDYTEFYKCACKVALGFKVPPNILSGDQLTSTEPVYAQDDWRVIKGQGNRTFIQQGCVIYPINDGAYGTTGVNYRHQTVIEVPIGTVEVTANRESLSMTPRTKEAIRNFITVTKLKINKYLNDTLDNCKNMLEAEKAANVWQDCFENVGTLKFKGKALCGYIRFRDDEIVIKNASNWHKASQWQNHIYEDEPRRKLARTEFWYQFSMSTISDLRFIITRSENKVIRTRVRIDKYRRLAKHRGDFIFVLQDPTSKQLASLIRRLGLTPDQIISVASLPDYPPVEKPISTRRGAPIERTGVYAVSSRGYLERLGKDATIPETFYWLGIDNGSASTTVRLGMFGALRLEDVHEQLKMAMYRIDVPERPVLYLTVSARKRLKVEETDNILNVIKELIPLKKDIILERITHQAIERKLAPIVTYNLDEKLQAVGIVIPNAISQIRNDPNMFLSDIYSEASTARNNGSLEARKLQETYPLLFNGDSTKEHIDQYVQLVRSQ